MLPTRQNDGSADAGKKGMRRRGRSTTMTRMDDELVERFLDDGFVKIEGAFPPRVAQHCASLLWRETGYDPEDPVSWKDPVVWVPGMAQGPFAAAANTPALHTAFDLLVGEDRWQSRYSLGTFPLRFPHAEEPDDAGWHIEGSYLPAAKNGLVRDLYKKLGFAPAGGTDDHHIWKLDIAEYDVPSLPFEVIRDNAANA